MSSMDGFYSPGKGCCVYFVDYIYMYNLSWMHCIVLWQIERLGSTFGGRKFLELLELQTGTTSGNKRNSQKKFRGLQQPWRTLTVMANVFFLLKWIVIAVVFEEHKVLKKEEDKEQKFYENQELKIRRG